VAIVTGAGRGIGETHARTLAALGARVVVNDAGASSDGRGASGRPAEVVARDINAAGGSAIADTTPVGTPDAAAAITDAALTHFGRVDILVNNAGVARSDWDTTLAVHLSGAFWLCKQLWPTFVAQGHGRIVNTTSSMGLFGSADLEGAESLDFYAYAAAKLGVVGLTRNLALHGAPHGIRVNAVAPLAWSRLAAEHPDQRFASWLRRYFPAEHVARVVAVLVDDECPCNGRTLSVGGGRVAEVVIAEEPGRLVPEPTVDTLGEHLGQPGRLEELLVLADSQEEVALFDRAVRGLRPPDVSRAGGSADGGGSPAPRA
jgi:NAD(P)-dependent dehydrogenase (short-subunit alcohol dehydrogenase family)